jgi:hypothetical protein
MHAPREETWQEKFKRSRYLVAAILFHLILFLMIATLVIWPAATPPPTSEFHRVAIRPPPPPPPPPVTPPDPGGSSASSELQQVPVVAHVAPPPSVITSMNTYFTLNVPKNMEQTLSNFSRQTAHGTQFDQGDNGSGGGTGSGFGSGNGPKNELRGNLYDLKQDPQRNPIDMDPGKYHRTISKFVTSGWDRTVFQPYYRTMKSLFTSCIFIPTIHAEDGPKAFHVEKEVQPNMYVVWYQLMASPPKDGTYHFVGMGDDILVVRVGNKTVLDGSIDEVDGNVRQVEKRYPIVNYAATERLHDAGNPNDIGLFVGPAFHATADTPVRIDILIGEEPGGYSNYFLFIQCDETKYTMQSNGTPLLPIFQVGSKPVNPGGDPSYYPPYSHTAEPWIPLKSSSSEAPEDSEPASP